MNVRIVVVLWEGDSGIVNNKIVNSVWTWRGLCFDCTL